MVEPVRHWESIWSEHGVDAVSWFQPAARRSLRLVTELAPEVSSPVIDVGGGASPLAGQLVAHGYLDVTVLDISAAALRAGRDRLGEHADAVRWTVADVTAHRFDRRYAVWHDRAVLHFLTDPADAARYAEQAAAAVEPGGHAVIATFGPQGPTRCSGLPVRRYDQQELTAVLGGGFEPVAFELEDHHTPGGVVQQFLYGTFRRS